MCLNYLKPLDKTSGYAIKCVTVTDKPDEFTTFWPYFATSGGGGRGDEPNRRFYTPTKKEVVKANVVYKLGRTYRVKHKRLARTDSPAQYRYPALVHCYKRLSRAVFEHGLGHNKRVYIIVKYSGGQYTDGVSLTAKYVTPLAVVQHEHINKFKKMEQLQGVDAAVKSYLSFKQWMED